MEQGPKAQARSVILLVEDNPADAHLVAEALDQHEVNHRLIHIKDGQTALEFFRDFDPLQIPRLDLVILDLNLPRKSGTIVLEAIRLNHHCRAVPVVILTSSDHQKDKDETERLGASAYCRKPSSLQEFMKLGEVFKRMVERPPS